MSSLVRLHNLLRDARWPGFVALQLVLAAVAIALLVDHRRREAARRALPPLREHPLAVEPLYDDPRVVSDEQLRLVLRQLRPRLRGPRPKVNHVDHALRFWGVEARFDDPRCLSGEEMRTLLVDHAAFTSAWGEAAHPLLMPRGTGVAVRTREGLASASHVDHTLACLAEVGTPLSHPVRTPGGQANARALLEQSLREFSLNQEEYEWSTLAYALYVDAPRGWLTTEGQRVDFDRLAERIMRQKPSQGVCLGHHRLHALVVLLRLHERAPLLGEAARARVVAHLREITRLCVASQHAQGYWTSDWSSGQPPTEGENPRDTLMFRLIATGHVLEWWALAPEELQPPRETVVRAGQWLSRVVIEMDDKRIEDNYTFLTHVGRALALWRNVRPAAALAAHAARVE